MNHKSLSWKQCKGKVIGIVLFLLLFSLNTILNACLKTPLEKINLKEFQSIESNSTVNYELILGPTNNVTQNLISSAFDYAYCRTQYPNENKVVDIILKSNVAIYRYPCTVSSEESSRDSDSDYNAIFAKIPTFSMKNGIYSVYLYVYENEHNYGLVDTGKIYEKKYERIYQTIDE